MNEKKKVLEKKSEKKSVKKKVKRIFNWKKFNKYWEELSKNFVKL